MTANAVSQSVCETYRAVMVTNLRFTPLSHNLLFFKYLQPMRKQNSSEIGNIEKGRVNLRFFKILNFFAKNTSFLCVGFIL
jgi:hypothetical protein